MHVLLLLLTASAIATATTGRLHELSPSPVSGSDAGVVSTEAAHPKPVVVVHPLPEVLARHQAEAAALSVSGAAEPTPQSAPSVTPEPLPQQASFFYTIQPGDTVESIAAAFEVNPAYILWNNPATSSDPNLLLVGETLLIPSLNGILYDVKLGDTLWDIAFAHEVSVDSIVGYSPNGLTSRDSVIAGMVLLLPDAVPPVPPAPEPAYVAEERVAEPGGAPIAAAAPTQVSSSGFIWPFVAPISTYFGEDGHKGLDIEGLGHYGESVSAAASGQVVLVVWSEWAYGNHVIIDHGDGTQTLYAHLSDVWVTEGQWVSQGESIGAIGSTGYSTGPHLHFEVRVGGFVVDPLEYLP